MPNLLKQLELEELSLVDRPANAQAMVSLYKRDNSNGEPMEHEIEKMSDDMKAKLKPYMDKGMSEEEAKKNKLKFTETAKTRIKTGLILNEFGEQNKINVSEQEIQAEVQKQLRMMPGQEKMVMDFYQKNPSAVASLRGTV